VDPKESEHVSISDRLPVFPWDRLEPYKAAAAAHQDGVVDLSVGTPVDPVPDVIRQALAAASDSPGYPLTYGTAALRESIARYLRDRHGIGGADPAAVLPLIGSKELVGWLPTLLDLRPGDQVGYPRLAYPTYEIGALIARAEPVTYDDPVAELDPARVKLLWLNSPSNPTGRVLTAGELRRIVTWAREHGILVVSDECYLELGWEGAEPVSVLHPSVCGDRHDGLLAGLTIIFTKPFRVGEYIEIDGPVDPSIFEKTLRHIVAEAEVLTVQFVECLDGPQQIIGAAAPWSLSVFDVSHEPDPLAVAEEQRQPGPYRGQTDAHSGRGRREKQKQQRTDWANARGDRPHQTACSQRDGANSFESIGTHILEDDRKEPPMTRQLDQIKALGDRNKARNGKRNRQMPEQLRAQRLAGERQRNQKSGNRAGNRDCSKHQTPLYSTASSLAGHKNISRTKKTASPKSTGQAVSFSRIQAGMVNESGAAALAARIIGPVAIEPGHAPFDALAEAGKAAVLDDGVVHGTHLAVAQHGVGGAIAARNVVGLPGPEGGFVDPAISRDRERRIPEGAFLFLELRSDGRQRPLALGNTPVIFRSEQPEIQFERIGGLGRQFRYQKAAACQKGQPGHQAERFQECEQVSHGIPPIIQCAGRCREARARSSATRQHLADKSAFRRTPFFSRSPAPSMVGFERNGVCDANDWGRVPGCHLRDAGGRAGAGRLGAAV